MTGTVDLENPDAGQNGVQGAAVLQKRSAEEIELLKQMRARVAVLDPESTDLDDASLHRFLRARSMDVKKASKMFADHQKWRREYFASGPIQEEEIRDELASGKYCIQGHDRSGHPIAVITASKHDHRTRKIDQFQRAIAYFLEKLIASMAPGVEKFVVLSDMRDVGFKSLDPRGWLVAYKCLQGYYPERLERVYILHPPMIFWAAWKMVVPFIDPVTKAKIVFVDNDKIEETLMRDINKTEIPIIYGGLKDLVQL